MPQLTTEKGKLSLVCPKCRTKGFLDADKVKPGEKVTLRCSHCKERFTYHNEKRAFFRKGTKVIVHYGEPGVDSDNFPGRAHLIDISMTGLRMKSYEPMKLDRLGISFLLPPSQDPIKALGEVVWIEAQDDGSYDIAIKFIRVDQHSKKQIGFFLMG